jgi:ElaB/YqjD/DUF883 family membrane-anchored ribosome-binding protein
MAGKLNVGEALEGLQKTLKGVTDRADKHLRSFEANAEGAAKRAVDRTESLLQRAEQAIKDRIVSDVPPPAAAPAAPAAPTATQAAPAAAADPVTKVEAAAGTASAGEPVQQVASTQANVETIQVTPRGPGQEDK